MRVKVISKSAILNLNGEMLLLRRSESDDRRPGGPDLPGGNLDEGEDVLMAASRELFEEAGLSVKATDLEIIGAETNIKDGLIIIQILSYSKVSVHDVKLSFEHDKYEWVRPDQAVKRFGDIHWGRALQFALDQKLLT